MTDRVNKLYSPPQLRAAIAAVMAEHPLLTEQQAQDFLIRMHKAGWRLVHVGKVGEK